MGRRTHYPEKCTKERGARLQPAKGFSPFPYTGVLSEHSRLRWLAFALSAPAVFLLYFFGLTRTGLLSADEPRYAAIGRTMAQSGDWVTPRLWGDPWFEKPALLYWMTATGFKLGWDQD